MKKKPIDLYQEITDNVLDALSIGCVPWTQTWMAPSSNPRSVSTGKRYQGINSLNLGLQQSLKGYASPWWLTYRQAQKLGGQVRKGEKSSHATYWMMLEDRHPAGHVNAAKPTGKGKIIPLLRHYAVFNLDQCDMPAEVLERLSNRLDRLVGFHRIDCGQAQDMKAVDLADFVISSYLDSQDITLNHGGDSAYYRPSTDTITMPEREYFESPEAYQFTLLHECMHSTGHDKRLKRGIGQGQLASNDDSYTREELVAELGAAFAGAHLGIERPELIENRNAYIQGWTRRLEEDKKAIVWAAGRASKACDLVLGIDELESEAEEALVHKE